MRLSVRKFIQKRLALRALRIHARLIMTLREQSAYHQADRLLPSVLPELSSILQDQKKSGDLHWPSTSYKLLELYRYCLRHRPRTIIELGSGLSTAVFLAYAREEPEVRLLTVDECAPYQERLLDRVGFRPGPTRQRLNLEREWTESSEISGCRYDSALCSGVREFLGGGGPDLLYVDGPSNIRDGVRLPCLDALALLNAGLPPRQILFDCRYESVRVFLQSPHAVFYDAQLHWKVETADINPWPVQPVRQHTCFIRLTDSPCIFSDVL